MPPRGKGKNTRDERGRVRIVVQLTDGRKSHFTGNVTRSYTFSDRTVSEVWSEIEAKMINPVAVASEGRSQE